MSGGAPPAQPTGNTFAPIPARAIGDQRLTGLHWRVLACIALHDRMSGNRGGQGCWAGNDTLAAECGCNYSNLSTAITELGRFGYVERTPHPLNGRLRVYRVQYTDEDRAFAKSANALPRGKTSPPEPEPIVCPQATENDPIVCPQTTKDGPIVCPDPKIESQNQGVNPVEYITRSVEYIPQKRERDSAEAARIEDGARDALAAPIRSKVLPSAWRGGENRSPGGFLAQCERLLKSGQPLALTAMRTRIEDIRDKHEVGDAVHGWAERLLDRIAEVQPT